MKKHFLSLLLVVVLGMMFTACNSPVGSTDKTSPTLSKEEVGQLFEISEEFHTNDNDNEITIKSHHKMTDGSSTTGKTPNQIWQNSDGSTSDFTLAERLTLPNGSLGTLQIPKIGLSVGVYETNDAVESMKHGAAHLKETSAWDGNIGLAAHNRGINTYFGEIHTLNKGDLIHYSTTQGERTYKVESSKTIDQMDWSMLGRTEDNRITLVTCIDNQPSQRLVVQAKEVSSSNTSNIGQ